MEATLLSLCRKLENLRGNGQLQHLDYRAEARVDGCDATGFPMWKPVDARGVRSRWAPRKLQQRLGFRRLDFSCMESPNSKFRNLCFILFPHIFQRITARCIALWVFLGGVPLLSWILAWAAGRTGRGQARWAIFPWPSCRLFGAVCWRLTSTNLPDMTCQQWGRRSLDMAGCFPNLDASLTVDFCLPASGLETGIPT